MNTTRLGLSCFLCLFFYFGFVFGETWLTLSHFSTCVFEVFYFLDTFILCTCNLSFLCFTFFLASS